MYPVWSPSVRSAGCPLPRQIRWMEEGDLRTPSARSMSEEVFDGATGEADHMSGLRLSQQSWVNAFFHHRQLVNVPLRQSLSSLLDKLIATLHYFNDSICPQHVLHLAKLSELEQVCTRQLVLVLATYCLMPCLPAASLLSLCYRVPSVHAGC
mmetsp:Transcript_28037/g.64464  ORF Transcript_28037/g.64464 Transcript_28037/m.64464 type:complete len:153 (-) Transcript_28037:51-509(-)